MTQNIHHDAYLARQGSFDMRDGLVPTSGLGPNPVEEDVAEETPETEADGGNDQPPEPPAVDLDEPEDEGLDDDDDLA